VEVGTGQRKDRTKERGGWALFFGSVVLEARTYLIFSLFQQVNLIGRARLMYKAMAAFVQMLSKPNNS